jgi:hypothetical protein
MRPIALFAAALSLSACGQAGDAKTPAPVANTGEAVNAAATLSLDARGVPRFRPGLWETTKTSEEGVEKSRECLGTEANRQIVEVLTRKDTPECKMDRSSGPGVLKVNSTCVHSGVKIRTELVLTGSDTQHEMKLKFGAEKPNGEVDGGEMVAQSRWVGACPADMAPGDEVEVD